MAPLNFYALLLGLVTMTFSPLWGQTLLFEEHFEDRDWAARGWYDNPRMEITAAEHIPGSGHAGVWHWQRAGDQIPAGGGARLKLPPVEDVTLEFYIKHCADWAWTGVDWHPHQFHFVTSADLPFVGPAHTHLTFYIEAVNGVPRLAIQDAANIDQERVGENLVGSTEERAVAGCNGQPDGGDDGDCYRAGQVHRNGKFWQADSVYFGDHQGPHYKGDWHQVRARFQLNSVVDGIGQSDGQLQYWFDGKLLIDRRDILFRTGRHPQMKINQFLMTPYYGPGVPHPQTIWIDELRIYSGFGAPEGQTAVGPAGDRASWGQIKQRAPHQP